MAISVSDALKKLIQAKAGVKSKRRLAYKRRYHNGTAFVWEADWKYLYQDDFVELGVVPWEADVPLENIVRAPVMTIIVRNEYNQWLQSDSPPSFFAADDVAPNGYRSYMMLLQPQNGYELLDGTTEWVPRFTGFLMGRAQAMPDGTAQLKVVSKSAHLLERYDASKVSEPVGPLEDCIPPTGDADGSKEFSSTSVGVDHLDDVQVNGTSLLASEYSADSFNEVPRPGNDGTVHLTIDPAPDNGHTVKVSGLKWLRNKTIEFLLAAICEGAGIGSSDRQIDSVVIPGDSAASQTINSKADWEAFDSATNLSTRTVEGSAKRKWWLIDDFSDGDYTADPAWTLLYGSASVVGGALTLNGTTLIGTSMPKAYGTWSFVTNNSVGVDMFFAMSSLGLGGTFGEQPSGNGYMLTLAASDVVQLWKWNGLGTPIILLNVSIATGGSHTWRVTRDSSGAFEVFKDGVSVGTASDNSYTTGSYLMFSCGPTGSNTYDDIYWSEEIDGAGAVSSADTVAEYVFDLATIPTAMGILERVQELNGGTVLYKTAGAPDSGASPPAPGTWDPLVEIAENGQMQHTPRRWLKIYFKITPNGFDSPEIQRLVAHFTVSEVVVALAVHHGNGAAAVERYASLVDYLTTDDEQGRRLFKSKNAVTDPVVDLDQENVVQIMNVDSGEDNIINIGRVRQGDFVHSYSCEDAAEASPTPLEEYGDRLPPGGQIELPEVILANNVDLAAGRSQTAHDRRHRPLSQIRAVIHDIPWLMVSDVVRFSLYDNPRLKNLVLNDPLLSAASLPVAGGDSPASVLAARVPMKVQEWKPNLDTGFGEVLLEVLPS